MYCISLGQSRAGQTTDASTSRSHFFLGGGGGLSEQATKLLLCEVKIHENGTAARKLTKKENVNEHLKCFERTRIRVFMGTRAKRILHVNTSYCFQKNVRSQ